MKRVNLKIFGDVQGVGFRYHTIQIARELEINGWVRNNPDGSVEIVAEGEKEKLGNLLTWAKTGPPLAKVAKVETDWQETTTEFTSFEVWR